METKVNVNKFCYENGIDPISLIQLWKNRNYPVYKLGGTYFVDNTEVISQALIIDNQRKLDQAKSRSQRARERSNRVRLERDLIREIEARGYSIENLDSILNLIQSAPPAQPPNPKDRPEGEQGQ